MICINNDTSFENSDNAVFLLSNAIWVTTDTLLMLLILGGNILTILAMKFNRGLSGVASNQFILNLAISDFLVGLSLPYHLAFYTGNALGTQKFTCLLCFCLISIACCLSIHSLIAVALDRYLAIEYPLQYGVFMTENMTRMMILGSWTISVLYGTMPIYWNTWSKCAPCRLHYIIPAWYIKFVMTPSFSGVWVGLVVFYFRIWRVAVNHTKRMKTSACNGARNNDWKSIQLVLLVLGSFSITWIPYLAIMFIQAFGITVKDPHEIIYKTTFSMAMANSGINPIVYAWKNYRFRKAFIRLLHCRSPEKITYNPTLRNNKHELNSSQNQQQVSVQKRETRRTSSMITIRESFDSGHESHLEFNKTYIVPDQNQNNENKDIQTSNNKIFRMQSRDSGVVCNDFTPQQNGIDNHSYEENVNGIFIVHL